MSSSSVSRSGGWPVAPGAPSGARVGPDRGHRITPPGPTKAVLKSPAHPYTRALINAAPRFFAPISDPLPGEIPSPIDLPPGCRFAGRCAHVQDDCRATDPLLKPVAGRDVACLHPVTQ